MHFRFKADEEGRLKVQDAMVCPSGACVQKQKVSTRELAFIYEGSSCPMTSKANSRSSDKDKGNAITGVYCRNTCFIYWYTVMLSYQIPIDIEFPIPLNFTVCGMLDSGSYLLHIEYTVYAFR